MSLNDFSESKAKALRQQILDLYEEAEVLKNND